MSNTLVLARSLQLKRLNISGIEVRDTLVSALSTPNDNSGTKKGMVFGPQTDFSTSLDSVDNLKIISVTGDTSDTTWVGLEILYQCEGHRRVIVEGGHTIGTDAGWGAALALAGESKLPNLTTLPTRKEIHEILTQARARLGNTDLIMATSTERPLLGLDGVIATPPGFAGELVPEMEKARSLTRLVNQCAAEFALLRPSLLAEQPLRPGRSPGSGAAGGLAQMITWLGGRTVSTGNILVDLLQLEETLRDTDLIIIVEPVLQGHLVAESTLPAITELAEKYALPVLVVTSYSSMSRHEQAQWGIHGCYLISPETGVNLEEIGQRILQTWLK